jgi:hypothetical protein
MWPIQPPAKVSKGNEELVRLSTYFTKPNDNEGVRKITFKFEIVFNGIYWGITSP